MRPRLASRALWRMPAQLRQPGSACLPARLPHRPRRRLPPRPQPAGGVPSDPPRPEELANAIGRVADAKHAAEVEAPAFDAAAGDDGHRGDVLLDAVFVDLEVLDGQVRNEAAGGIRDGKQQVDLVDVEHAPVRLGEQPAEQCRQRRRDLARIDLGRRAGQVDMTDALRSPGSALKPFIYGLAFDARGNLYSSVTSLGIIKKFSPAGGAIRISSRTCSRPARTRSRR